MSTKSSVMSRSMLWVLLGSLVLLQFGYPINNYGTGWSAVYLLLYIGVIWFGVRQVASSPRRHWPIAIAVLLFVIAGTWSQLNQNSHLATVAILAAIGLLQLSLVVTLIGAMLRPNHMSATADLILIAVCAYLLLGGVFGVLASQLEFAYPGSYVDASIPGDVTWQALFYGSYVTLSTLGYGDILPVGDWARSLSSFESVFGTLFVAVVIAQLVGAGVRWRSSKDISAKSAHAEGPVPDGTGPSDQT